MPRRRRRKGKEEKRVGGGTLSLRFAKRKAVSPGRTEFTPFETIVKASFLLLFFTILAKMFLIVRVCLDCSQNKSYQFLVLPTN
jgi:hypothetical protein